VSRHLDEHAFRGRGSDRAKIVSAAGRGYNVEDEDGNLIRGVYSQKLTWEIDQWVTMIQTRGHWQIVGRAANAPQGTFAPEPEGS
jgi:hypothetical protein